MTFITSAAIYKASCSKVKNKDLQNYQGIIKYINNESMVKDVMLKYDKLGTYLWTKNDYEFPPPHTRLVY